MKNIYVCVCVLVCIYIKYILCVLQVLVLYPEPTPLLCTLFVWHYHLGFCLLYGSLVLKTWRSVLSAFYHARVMISSFGPHVRVPHRENVAVSVLHFYNTRVMVSSFGSPMWAASSTIYGTLIVKLWRSFVLHVF